MNLPNKLTLTRIILVPVFMIFVSLSQYMTPSYNPRWYLIAGIIFAVDVYKRQRYEHPAGRYQPADRGWCGA